MEDGGQMPLGSDGLHHVGATVADLDRSLAFWEAFLGRARRFELRFQPLQAGCYLLAGRALQHRHHQPHAFAGLRVYR